MYGKFENEIKKEWILNYQNHENIPGLSVNRAVTAEDEWCAEAYMETDYSILSKKDFIYTALVYTSFLLSNAKIQNAIHKPTLEQEMILHSEEWVEYKLDDLFEITGSKTTPLLELEEYGEGAHPFVTTQATNNGVEGFYDYSTEKGNVLTIDSAVIGYCSYQALDFSASDHVEKLTPKFEIDAFIGLFLATILNKEQYRYNYGRKASQTRLRERSVKLPSKNNQPDWDFMRKYVQSLPYSSNIQHWLLTRTNDLIL